MKGAPTDRSAVDAIKAWRKLPRAERRATWKRVNRSRAPGTPRAPWRTLPLFTPLQAHIVSGKGHPHSQKTRAVSLGFSRAQRRAMLAKKGSHRMLEPVWGIPGAPGFVKSRPTAKWPGLWSKFAVRLEFNRRLMASVAEYQHKNVFWRRWLRFVGRLIRRMLKRK